MKSLGGARAGWPRVLQGVLTDCLEEATKERMCHKIWRINRGSGCTACGRGAEYFSAAFLRPGSRKMGCFSSCACSSVRRGTGVLPAPAEIAWTPGVPSSLWPG